VSSRVLLTGATGYLGTRLQSFLSDAGYTTLSLSRRPTGLPREREVICDLTDVEALRAAFLRLKPDFLIHLAARARPDREYGELPLHFEETVLPSVNLALAAPLDLRLAIFVGSCEEYGNAVPPFDETQAAYCMSPYGWAKSSAFLATRMVARSRGLPWTWLRPFLVFGPGQRSKALIPSVIRACLDGAELQLTSGAQTRDFLYARDFQRMIDRILQEPEPAIGTALNLCTGVPRTVRSVAELIRDQIGAGELRFGAVPHRLDEAMSFFGSTALWDRLYGPMKHTAFPDAIADTIRSYRV
jgi:UDP-glucose 4-epimerase